MTLRNKQKVLLIALACWLVAFVVAMIIATMSYAADATFSWLPNTEPDLAGYKIHYGSAAGAYDQIIDVGLPDPVDGRIRYTISDVSAGITYYTATAYDTGGLESDYSNEVEFNPAPAPPADLRSITVNVTVTVQ